MYGWLNRRLQSNKQITRLVHLLVIGLFDGQGELSKSNRPESKNEL